MPRPAEITPADIERWDNDLKQVLQEPRGQCMQFFDNPQLRDVWYAGQWLAAKLHELGASVQQINEIGFATGQRQAFHRDPWPFSLQAVANYQKGIFDSPGAELALQLYQEMFGKK